MLLGDDTQLTDTIMGCAPEVHRHLELTAAGLTFTRQVGVPLFYKGMPISEHRPDLVVSDRVIVEVKSVERLHPIHVAQMVTYLKVTGKRTGLVLNFNCALMKHGIRRVLR